MIKMVIMKVLCVFFCLLVDIHVIAGNLAFSYSGKEPDPYENKIIKLRELEFRDSTIVNILSSDVPEIKDICRLNSENNYIRMVFKNDSLTQIVLLPEHLECQFTIDFWEIIRNNIIGYLYVDNILVIVQGESAKRLVKKRKRTKILNIIHYPPSNASDWSFWRYTINDGIVTKEKHLTKKPQILF
jgi:hypothetical protein